jgi:hypothetical protein
LVFAVIRIVVTLVGDSLANQTNTALSYEASPGFDLTIAMPVPSKETVCFSYG